MKTIDFCFDHLSNSDMGYPNLAQPGLAPDQFDCTWPLALPVRLFAYFPTVGMQHRTWLVEQAPTGSWYPVALGWHNFECDYFDLLSDLTKQRVRQGHIRLLFYYHEGDNPARIHHRFECLRHKHNFPENSYLFLSANSAANQLRNFKYFPDHELFFRYVNRHQRSNTVELTHREKEFTVLNRTHKWWRATCMADLHRAGLLDRSLWSYNRNIDVGDVYTDNPIRLGAFAGLEDYMQQFLDQSPYVCDALDETQHNDHRLVNVDLYTKSWCHIVLETHFDADQSGGTFLTEKTYKCLKFGQPFVIAGPPHSLQALRDRGYRVFDHAIDNSYDTIVDNTARWAAVKETLSKLATTHWPSWFESCLDDIQHNQQKFQSGHSDLLAELVSEL